jgi:chorismate mutase
MPKTTYNNPSDPSRQQQVLRRVQTASAAVRHLPGLPANDKEAPALAALMQRHRLLVFELMTADREPNVLIAGDQMLRTVLAYEIAQARDQAKQVELEQGDRKLAILEQRMAQGAAAEGGGPEFDMTPEEREARIREIYGR